MKPLQVRVPSALKGNKILIVLSTLELGGAERQAIRLAQYLNKRGAQVCVLGLSKIGLAAAKLTELDIPWKLVPFRWPCRRSTLYKTLTRLIWEFRRQRPDLILSYSRWANIACGLGWKLSGANACIWNQRDLDEDGLLDHYLARRAANNVTDMICNSRCAEELVIERLHVPRHRIRIIYNALDVEHRDDAQGAWRETLELSRDDLLACMVANFRHPKDHATLIRAWHIVANRIQDAGLNAHLLLAGAVSCQDTYQHCKQLVAELDLVQFVHFLGQVTDVSALLRTVDLGVFSSLSESSPNGLLECMAVGLPLVATDIPAIREAVGEAAADEILAPPRDSLTLADRIMALLCDPIRCETLGMQNQRRISTEYDITAVHAAVEATLIENLHHRHDAKEIE